MKDAPQTPLELLTARHFMAGPVWDEWRDWLERLSVPFCRVFFWPGLQPGLRRHKSIDLRSATSDGAANMMGPVAPKKAPLVGGISASANLVSSSLLPEKADIMGVVSCNF